MATKLPRDFKEFLKLLDKHDVEYLLIGRYAVAYYVRVPPPDCGHDTDRHCGCRWNGHQ